jgi:hypothetical protein
MTPLAQWLHDRRLDCKWEYNDPADIGMGRRYTDDHEPAHERAAAELLLILGLAGRQVGETERQRDSHGPSEAAAVSPESESDPR